MLSQSFFSRLDKNMTRTNKCYVDIYTCNLSITELRDIIHGISTTVSCNISSLMTALALTEQMQFANPIPDMLEQSSFRVNNPSFGTVVKRRLCRFRVQSFGHDCSFQMGHNSCIISLLLSWKQAIWSLRQNTG